MKSRKILKNKYYLYATEFFAGMSVMERAELLAEQIGDEGLREMMDRVLRETMVYTAGDYLLTDDRAPVEVLGMQVIDELISDEMEYYKEIYREQGIRGLLENF